MKNYRPEIDGLRAVAVLPVIWFHLGIPGMTGGYAGVDVFFVISGYLIGRGILQDLAGGSFSIQAFYERRFRRILPALFSMLSLATIVVVCRLVPDRVRDYADSLIATTASLSNFYFLRGSGYFFGSEDKILLHTWSLAVEEQFYLLFPIFCLLIFRIERRALGRLLTAAAAASFALSVLLLSRRPEAAFYLLPPRAWELLLGVLVAHYEPLNGRPRPTREAAAGAGLLLILVSMMTFVRDTPFPGWRAMPPCLGASLIIAARLEPGTVIGRILAWRPLVFIGLLSYSLYLFHWPTIVLAREAFGFDTGTAPVRMAVLATTFALAWLSWRFVEGPLRRRPAARSSVFTSAALASAGALAAGTLLIVSSGLPQRYSARTNEIAAYLRSGEAHFRSAECPQRGRDWGGACLRDDPVKPGVLVIGDSFSAHLWFGLNTAFPGINFKQATLPGCRPLIEMQENVAKRCADFMSAMLNTYVPNHPAEPVILAADWVESNLPRIAQTLDFLNSKHIRAALVGPPPQYISALPELLSIANERGDPGLVARGRRSDTGRLDDALAQMAQDKQVRYVSLFRYLCNPGCDTTTDSGVPLQFDRGHFTAEGSLVAAGAFRSLLAPAPPMY